MKFAGSTEYQSHTANQADFRAGGKRSSSFEKERQKNYKQKTDRSQAEDLAKKSSFSFVQKAGFVGAGITALLLLMKSRVLSFLTALPTAGLLYFGFKSKLTNSANKVQEEPRAQEEQKPQHSPETMETISKLNELKDQNQNTLVKNYIHNVTQALALTDSFDVKELASQLLETMEYKADKKTIRTLQTQLHPDKHSNETPEIIEIYKKLFTTIGAYKDLANSSNN